ncbi:MAG: alpha-amylase family glycosyl hydrolase, partial [Kribbellaceae bacterium]
MAPDRPARSVPQTLWWQGAVIYENHLPTFRDGDGDGVGDLRGLVDSLDYLAEVLRVDAIWVGPFYRSPLLDQGFDISDHYDVEPVFGSLATVDKLLAEAHARGLKVIADYVPNHTSDQHPWFVESRSSRDDPRRDWYVWADPHPDGSAPNNWISESGGPAWELDAATGQYYLHSHLLEQPDLNWRNPQVRSAMLDVLRFWLDRGVDGVRIDVAHMLMKDPLLRDNPPNPSGEPNPWDIQHPDFTSQLHVHDRLHPDVHEVLREIRGVLDSYDDRVAIAEIEALSWEPWAEFFGAELDGIHLPFAFRLIETAWQADALAAELRELQSALPPAAWPCLA